MEKVKKFWQLSKSNSLVSGSLIMFVGTNIHNFGQLLYHYLAINMLSKAHYGDLAALVSIFGLLAIIQQSLALAVVKFIASSKSEEEANNLTRWVVRWSIWISVILGVVILCLTPILSGFLHITELTSIYLFAPVVAIAFISNTGRALLQGFTKFSQLSLTLILEVTIKIFFTFIFLYIGYQIFGAVVGLLIGVLAGLTSVWFFLKNKWRGVRVPVNNLGKMFKYSIPVLAQSLALTSMVSSDVLLVKHFFNPDLAGSYAALAKLGTIALYATSPITQVMFPLIAKRHSHGNPYHKVFYLSLIIISFVSFMIVLIYFFFGNNLVGILTSGKYIQESYLLWWMGLYMLLIGVSMSFTQFYLSIGKTVVVWFFIAAAITQIVLILIFHQSLLNVVQSSIFSVALLVLFLSIYFPYHDRKK